MPRKKAAATDARTRASRRLFWRRDDSATSFTSQWGVSQRYGKGIRYGYQATLKGYKKTYADLKAMGNLDFDILHVLNAGPKAVVVVGKWKLIRDKDMPESTLNK